MASNAGKMAGRATDQPKVVAVCTMPHQGLRERERMGM